jgi:hypothetical protein
VKTCGRTGSSLVIADAGRAGEITDVMGRSLSAPLRPYAIPSSISSWIASILPLRLPPVVASVLLRRSPMATACCNRRTLVYLPFRPRLGTQGDTKWNWATWNFAYYFLFRAAATVLGSFQIFGAQKHRGGAFLSAQALVSPALAQCVCLALKSDCTLCLDEREEELIVV